MKSLLNIFLFFSIAVQAQNEKSFSVYLIGDAGEHTTSGKALLILKEQLLNDPNSAVVFLGDNVYPSGFSVNDQASKFRLESQLEILKGYRGSAYFIPGNHDWDEQRRKGLKKVKEQQVYVNDYLKSKSAIRNKDNAFYPADGLPGPETVMLTEKLRLIMIDTQWFLHFHKKNKIGSKKNTRVVFYKKLDSLLAYSSSKGEQVLISAHHPIFTNGSHSRRLQPWRFLVNCTPFKIFGVCGLDRLFSQDINQPGYRRMRKKLQESLGRYNNIIYASGHDHNVQFFKEQERRYIVSGNGSKTSRLKKQRFEAVYQDDSSTGFVKLEFDEDKIKTSIYRVDKEVKVLEGY
jgi:hypothetical protein